MSDQTDEILGVLGKIWLKVETLEAKVKKQRQEIRRLAFYMQLEFVVILFLSIGMGILARAMN